MGFPLQVVNSPAVVQQGGASPGVFKTRGDESPLGEERGAGCTMNPWEWLGGIHLLQALPPEISQRFEVLPAGLCFGKSSSWHSKVDLTPRGGPKSQHFACSPWICGRWVEFVGKWVCFGVTLDPSCLLWKPDSSQCTL